MVEYTLSEDKKRLTTEACATCGAELTMPEDPTKRPEHDCPMTCYGWDALKEKGKQPAHARPFGPDKSGSPYCRSGSLASGGKHPYCTCDTCF